MLLGESMQSWINPLGTEYTIPFTLFCAFLFVSIAYLIYKLLEKIKVKVDYRLAASVFPFIILGSMLRVYEDMGILTSKLFVTPYIYFLVASIFLFLLTIFRKLEEKGILSYDTPLFLIGVIGISFLVQNFGIVNFKFPLLVILFLAPWAIFLKFLKNYSIQNKIVLFTQIYDGTITSISLAFFGYVEKHVLPTFIIRITNFPFSFLISKILITILVLYVIDKWVKDKNLSNYLKLLIGFLPLATGTRDFLRVLMNV